MDELRESSLLFSLESLLETERERVEREAREARDRREQDVRRVAEAAERRRLAVEQEKQARLRREALEQERERLEQERLSALKSATVERVRLEAESHARILELTQSRQHDLALASLRAGQSTAHYRTLFWVSASGLGVAIVFGVAAFFTLPPAHARELERQRAVVAATEERASAAERALAAERSKSQLLEQRVAQLRPLAPAPLPPVREGALPVKAGGTARVVAGPKKVCSDTGDPLDGCMR